MVMEEDVLIDRRLRFGGISSVDLKQGGHASDVAKSRWQQIYGGYTDCIVNNGMIEEEEGKAMDAPRMLNPAEEVFNLQTDMELMSFPSKNPIRSYEQPDGGSSSSRMPSGLSYRRAVFAQDEEPAIELTKHGIVLNAQPADHYRQRLQNRHGLSLSLSPHIPTELRVRSFESNAADEFRYGLAHQAQSASCPGQYLIKSSKYLPAAQELLYEFCNLGTKHHGKNTKQPSIHETTNINSSLYTVDFPELQKRKCRLVSMLKVVDMRYMEYCEQMREVVASFEAVVGEGSAQVYSSLASMAMSKHFRCLRDGILGQIKAIRLVLGEKVDSGPSGTTKGETPRLRLLYQNLKQQKAYENVGMIENQPWRPQRGLPERSVSTLRAWLFEHFLHPYPSDVDKHVLSRQTGLSRSQVSNWFINARVRLWKPMVEEMYLEEEKEQEYLTESGNSILQRQQETDEQPELPHVAGSLSSVINVHLEARRKMAASTHTPHGGQDSGGTKNHHGQLVAASVPCNNSASSCNMSFDDSPQRQYANINGGASLTLGLHHHHDNSAHPNFYNHQPLFFSRDSSCAPLDECSSLHFSLTQDGVSGQGAHGDSVFEQQADYRSGPLAMGKQLLQDHFVG